MNRCLDRNQIEEYLSGWADPAAGELIESHLAECEQCEQTVTQLEQETDRFFPSIGSLVAASESATSDDPMQQVLQTVRQWNPVEIAGNPESTPANRPFPTSDFGPFEIVELIGRGGMAEVYRARHKRLDRDVAIKLLPVPQGKVQESLERIDREIRAVGRLRHPAIVSAVDAGEYNQIPYLATEYIDGFDLGKIARRVQTLNIADACEIVRQVALGLDYAHANGVIHRDIKPSNIMLDRNGTVKILDFGLVRLDQRSGVPAELTSVGQLLGTLDYMAPEQADRADSVDHRSDIYSLGATLFRLLAGRAPYAATANQSPLEKLRLLAVDQPPHIQTLRPDLPDPLSKLVDQTLARDPSQRPASAAHLAEALLPFCEGADTSAVVAQVSSIGAIHFEEEFGYSSEASLLASSQIPAKPATAGGTSRGTGIRRWLIGAGFAAAAVVAGIILVLELQKGRVIIETESANLNVSLVEIDSGRSQDVQVFPGKNSTRIQAGRYEIRIDDGSDRYVLEQNGFVLKRGETVVVRIQVDSANRTADIAWSDNSRAYAHQPKPQDLKSATPATTRYLRTYQATRDPNFIVDVIGSILPEAQEVRIQADSDLSQIIVFANQEQHVEIEAILKELDAPPKTNTAVAQALEDKTLDTKIASASDGPLYEGKSLDEWIAQGESDLSPDVRTQAVRAISTIARNDRSSLEQVRNYLSKRSLPSDSIVWEIQLAGAVGLANSHKDQLLKQLATSSEPVTMQILNLLQQDARYHEELRSASPNDSLIAAIETISSRLSQLKESEIASLRQWFGYFFQARRNYSFKTHKTLLESYLRHDWLGPSLALSQNRSFFDEIGFFAEAAMQLIAQTDNSIEDREFGLAISILSSYLIFLNRDDVGLQQKEWIGNLLTALDQRLLTLADNPAAYQQLDDRVYSGLAETHPTVVRNLINQFGLALIEIEQQKARGSETLGWTFPFDSDSRNYWKLFLDSPSDPRSGPLTNQTFCLIALMHRAYTLLDSPVSLDFPGLKALIAATEQSRNDVLQSVQEKLQEHGPGAMLVSIRVKSGRDHRGRRQLETFVFSKLANGDDDHPSDGGSGGLGSGGSGLDGGSGDLGGGRSGKGLRRETEKTFTLDVSEATVTSAIIHDSASNLLALFSKGKAK